MKASIGDALGLPAERIFLKQRKRQRGSDQYDRVSREGISLTVKERDLQFEVNLSDYLDTGLFLDHRATRHLVGQESAGKKVLNLFCYTAAFSVYAARGGAAEVDSVDLSNTYLDWAARNFELNGRKAQRMTPEEYTNMKTAARDPNRLIRADAIRFLDEAARAARSWDLIILDPPTFSNSKKMEGNLDIRRDSNDLIGRCLRVLSPQGTLWFSTNARGFRLLQDSFPGYGIKDMKALTTDEDFREKQNRSCYTIFHER
jgi:23S rRNA G2069 N7-methylase RlmK/C1962 C5-methylase RlmI